MKFLLFWTTISLGSACYHLLPTIDCPSGVEYTFTVGNTLSVLATKYKTTVKAIMLANRQIADANMVFINQKICIVQNQDDIKFNPSCSTIETVVSGDTCFNIATRLGKSLQDFQSLNPKLNCGTNLQPGETYCGDAFPDSCTQVFPEDGEDSEEQDKPHESTPDDPHCTLKVNLTNVDTCDSLSKASNLTLDTLSKINPLLCCTALKEGQSVCLSGKPYGDDYISSSRLLSNYNCPSPAPTTTPTPSPATSPSPSPSPRPTPAAPAPRNGKIGSSTEEVNAHNKCRRDAKRDNPLISHDSSLAANSADYAAYLATSRSCTMQHSSGDYGENIYFTSGAPDDSIDKDAVDAWCGREPLTRFLNNHHSQVAWSRTSRVGCGYGYNPSCGTIYVCRYFPAGNTINVAWDRL